MNRLGMTVPVAGETMADLPAVLDELAGAGYTDIWTSEVNATDAFAPLLMAAQQVPQLRLGTSIAGVFSRSPALMAMSALAVAELSDEPIYVGVGSSSQNMVEQWHGTPFVQPYQRVRDTVRFLRAAFAGQRVTFHGDSFEIDGFRLALAAVPDSVIDELFLIGSPAEIRSGVADYVRAGITIPVLAVLGPDQESIRTLSVELGRPADEQGAAPGA